MTAEYEQGQTVLNLMADDEGLGILRRELATLYRRRKAASGHGPDWSNAWVSADDGRRIMSRLGIEFKTNNRLGALFRSPEWEWAGFFVKSETKGSHGNRLIAWRLKA